MNLTLIPINPKNFILGGTAGAAFATAVCHMISSFIEFKVLKREIKLKLNYKKFILKPIIAVGSMGLISYELYKYLLNNITNSNLPTIISILVATIIYLLMLIFLKIFSEEDINMMPYGKKLYKFFKKHRLYAKRRIALKY